jgi:hypothetical protein
MSLNSISFAFRFRFDVQNCRELFQFRLSPACKRYDACCNGLAHLAPSAGCQSNACQPVWFWTVLPILDVYSGFWSYKKVIYQMKCNVWSFSPFLREKSLRYTGSRYRFNIIWILGRAGIRDPRSRRNIPDPWNRKHRITYPDPQHWFWTDPDPTYEF